MQGEAGASSESTAGSASGVQRELLRGGLSAPSCPPPPLSPAPPGQSGQSADACDLGGWEGVSQHLGVVAPKGGRWRQPSPLSCLGHRLCHTNDTRL